MYTRWKPPEPYVPDPVLVEDLIQQILLYNERKVYNKLISIPHTFDINKPEYMLARQIISDRAKNLEIKRVLDMAAVKANTIINDAKKEAADAIDVAQKNAVAKIALATAKAGDIIVAAKKIKAEKIKAEKIKAEKIKAEKIKAKKIKAEKEALFSKYSYDKLQKIAEIKIKPIILVDDLDHESYFTASKKILKPIEQIKVEIKPNRTVNIYSHPMLKHMRQK